ncbi:MAG: Toxin RTX-I translocation ATP-binding protein [Chlamydiae bacterium]|nr:Toxin RTX-I translocation ATP-binding protein [Chlamydiota bacterium]
MNEDLLLDQSLSHLKGVISSSSIEKPPETEGSLLYRACSLLAGSWNRTLPLPDRINPTLEEICSVAKVRYREISLKTDWWKEDRGSFIGFFGLEKKPVAVIFANHKVFHIVDPETEKHTIVDEKTASLLSEEAYMLYPPLPEDVHKLHVTIAAIFSAIRWEYTSVLFIGLVMIFFGFAFPLTNKILYDYIIPNYNYTIYTQLFMGLPVIVASSAIFFFFRTLLLVRIKGLLTNSIQIGLWDRILRLPVNFFQTIASGDLLQRTMIFNQIKERISNQTLTILVNGFFSLFYIIVMVIFSWQLTLIGVSLILLWSILAFFILLVKIGFERKLLESEAKIQAFLIQVIHAMPKVRTAVLEKRLFSKWMRDFSFNQSLTLKVLNLENIINASKSFITVLLPLCIYGFVIYKKGKLEEEDVAFLAISVGSFLAFLAAFSPFSQSFLQAVSTLASLSEFIPFWKRVSPLLTTPVEKGEGKADPGVLQGEILVHDLHFRYGPESPLILKEVDLSLKAGQFVGLVGKTGCGKSTLCRILFGFEEVSRSALFYDNQDATELDIFKVRKQIGFIFQENKIFQGNIYDNLTCGRKCTKHEIERALTLSTFDEELASLPMGLDTRLSSVGGLLSGGQKQKLLLARAILTNPQIYLIDEGLNTLDNRTQERVLANLRSLSKTILLTSHRLNVLEKADKIYVMEEGEITASGTFQELTSHAGLFQRFASKQTL